MLAVFSAPALPAATAGVPRTGRRVQSNSTILACAVEIGQHEGVIQPEMVLSRTFVSVPFVVYGFLCENFAESSEEPQHESLSNRLLVPARSHVVQLRAN